MAVYLWLRFLPFRAWLALIALHLWLAPWYHASMKKTNCTRCNKQILVKPYKLKQPRIFCSGHCRGKFYAEVAAENGRKSSTKHGMSKTRTHKSWESAKARCNNPNDPTYFRYGAVGIKFCSQWDDFSAFFEDMGERPAGTSLDRIDTNGDYCPENCRWADARTQNRHARINITHDGKTMCVHEWATYLGLPVTTMHKRREAGWSMDLIVSTPYLGRASSSQLK